MTFGSLGRGRGEVETVEKWLQICLEVAVLLRIGFRNEELVGVCGRGWQEEKRKI
jgi:hypothetical protein